MKNRHKLLKKIVFFTNPQEKFQKQRRNVDTPESLRLAKKYGQGNSAAKDSHAPAQLDGDTASLPVSLSAKQYEKARIITGIIFLLPA